MGEGGGVKIIFHVVGHCILVYFFFQIMEVCASLIAELAEVYNEVRMMSSHIMSNNPPGARVPFH